MYFFLSKLEISFSIYESKMFYINCNMKVTSHSYLPYQPVLLAARLAFHCLDLNSGSVTGEL